LLLLFSFSGMKRDRELAARLDHEKSLCRDELAKLHGESDAQRAALVLLQSPTAQLVSLAPPPGEAVRSARALVDLAQKKGMLVSASLSPQPGKDYELWIIRGQLKLPAGILQPGPSGPVRESSDPQPLPAAPDASA